MPGKLRVALSTLPLRIIASFDPVQGTDSIVDIHAM